MRNPLANLETLSAAIESMPDSQKQMVVNVLLGALSVEVPTAIFDRCLGIALQTVEARCGARAASCICVEPAGHVEAGDPVHSCDPARCSGKWTGAFSTPTFRIVVIPRRIGATS